MALWIIIKHKTPGSEMKGTLLFRGIAVTWVSSPFVGVCLWISISTKGCKDSGLHCKRGTLSIRNLNIFLIGSKYAWPLLQRKNTSLHSKAVKKPGPCFGGRQCFYFQSCLLYKHPKSSQCFVLQKCAEMQGELSLNTEWLAPNN